MVQAAAPLPSAVACLARCYVVPLPSSEASCDVSLNKGVSSEGESHQHLSWFILPYNHPASTVEMCSRYQLALSIKGAHGNKTAI